MEMKRIEWCGFEGLEFVFEGMKAKIIKPKVTPNKKWLLKTEYFDAFPGMEIELLKRGWHLAYNQNKNRWAEQEDLQRKANFVHFISKEFGLNEKCVPVGMSCGGLYAVKLAAMIPENIQALYLDAPVMNLLSCPFGFGKKTDKTVTAEEYIACTGRTQSEMLSYRDHPIDKTPILLMHDIPVVLVSGDGDTIVPYEENGQLLENYYKENGGRIEVFIKKGGNHHPHGLEDSNLLANKIEEFANF